MERLRQKIVTLLSDFGLRGSYVAEMKAIIMNKCPEARIVDVTHEIDKFDIRMGAFVLASAAPYFPDGTVHVAVVDPGVGTSRRPIVVESSRCFFVGPDNGVLMLAALKEGLRHVYAIENTQYMLPRISKTFHGRDVFAPTAAYLAKGLAAPEFGSEIKDYVVPTFSKPCLKDNAISGEILHIDDFGNIITNITLDFLDKVNVCESQFITVEIAKEAARLKFCSAYGDVSRNEALVLVGSHDFLEVSVNQGSAAERFRAKRGDSVLVWR